MKPIAVGDKAYLFVHYYVRVVGRVAAVWGRQRVGLEEASVLHSAGNYEAFLAGNTAAVSSRSYVGDLEDVPYLFAKRLPEDFDLAPKKGKER